MSFGWALFLLSVLWLGLVVMEVLGWPVGND
jgi:hypothetical protein